MNGIDYGPDPVVVGQKLARSRAAGTPFDVAWQAATAGYDRGDVYDFMRRHFQAAYNGDDSSRGRCMVPPSDTSSAIPMRTFTGTNAERDTAIAQAVASGHTQAEVAQAHGITAARVSQIVGRLDLPKASHDHERCRSGDGCDRLATRGRYGRTFCDYHGEELERIADKFWKDRADKDPRKVGNAGIFKERRAAA